MAIGIEPQYVGYGLMGAGATAISASAFLPKAMSIFPDENARTAGLLAGVGMAGLGFGLSVMGGRI